MIKPVSAMDPTYLSQEEYRAWFPMGDYLKLEIFKKSDSPQLILLHTAAAPGVPLLLSYVPEIFQSKGTYPDVGIKFAFASVYEDASQDLLDEIRLASEKNILRNLRAPSFAYLGRNKPTLRAMMNTLTLDFCDDLLKDDLESFQGRYVGYLLWQRAAEQLFDQLKGHPSKDYYANHVHFAGIQVERMVRFLEVVKSYYLDHYQVTPRFPDENGLVGRVIEIQKESLL
ncbi:MAG: hypothetical protein WCV90_08455 [Candidatus Woesearchaeota archaeon]|jgi:hypothetical protein